MSKNTSLRNIRKATTLILGLLVVMPVGASSFALNEQGVSHLGNAYAGTSSSIQDASTGYYNPAGLGELKHNQIVLSSTYIKPKVKIFDAKGTLNQGDPLSGNNTSKSNTKMLIPAGHLAWHVSKDFSLGLSVVEPFGMKTVYGSSAFVRYYATDTRITTVDISPTFSYKLNHKWSVGAGLDFLRTSMLTAAGVAFGNTGAEAHGAVTNKASSWTMGYHVGLLYKPWNDTKMGLVYCSGFNPRFSGYTWANNLSGSLPSSVSYSMRLPDRLNYSVTHQVNHKWATMAEAEWTHWSRLKTIRFNYNAGARPGYVNFYYKNTWRLGLGGDYKVSPAWTLKGGVSYDQSPSTNAYRSVRFPDSNRYLLALGAKFTFSKQLSINAGYAHVFFKNTSIAQKNQDTLDNPDPLNADDLRSLTAKVKKSTDIVGLQIAWNLVW